MSQRDNVTDLPAREKKKRKRKSATNENIVPQSQQNNNNHNKEQILEAMSDFLLYSLKKNTEIDSENKDNENENNENKKTETNTEKDNNKLTQKIHEFHTKPDNKENDTVKASQYIKKLRNENNENESNDSSDNESDNSPVDDPLLTLLQIEATTKDQPTTIEYDDRVYDKVIFQDEEFKQYRKNNIAIKQNKFKFHRHNTDKIIHYTKKTYMNNNIYITQHKNNNNEAYHHEEDHNFAPKSIGKMKANYFIALKITDMRIKRKLKQAQNILLKELNDKIYERALIDESMFHITINTIYCASDDEIFYLINQFEEFGKNMFQKLIPTKLSVRLHVNGIYHFRQKVIYGNIEDDGNKRKIENVYHALHSQFQNAGIVNQQHRFDPHLTIMKLSKIKNNKKLSIPIHIIEKLNNEYNKSLDFGYQYVNGLELLSMVDERNNNNEDVCDYYQCISTITPYKLR